MTFTVIVGCFEWQNGRMEVWNKFKAIAWMRFGIRC